MKRITLVALLFLIGQQVFAQVTSVTAVSGSGLIVSPTTGSVTVGADPICFLTGCTINALTILPTALSGTVGSSGSLAPGTYFAKIVQVGASGASSTTVASDEGTETVPSGPSSGSIAWTWTAVSGASSYQIWIGSSPGGENCYFTSSTASYTETTTAGCTTGTIPTNTPGVLAIGDMTFVDSSNYASLAAACSDAVSKNAVLTINTTYTNSNSAMTCAADLLVGPSGMIVTSGGFSVTLTSARINAPYSGWITQTPANGAVIFTGLKEVYADWFGADHTGTVDSTAAINNATYSASLSGESSIGRLTPPKVVLLAGVYLIGNPSSGSPSVQVFGPATSGGTCGSLICNFSWGVKLEGQGKLNTALNYSGPTTAFAVLVSGFHGGVSRLSVNDVGTGWNAGLGMVDYGGTINGESAWYPSSTWSWQGSSQNLFDELYVYCNAMPGNGIQLGGFASALSGQADQTRITNSQVAYCAYGTAILGAGANATKNVIQNSSINHSHIGVYSGPSNPAISIIGSEIDANDVNFMVGPAGNFVVRDSETQGSIRQMGNGTNDATDQQTVVIDNLFVQGYGNSLRPIISGGSFEATATSSATASGNSNINLPYGTNANAAAGAGLTISVSNSTIITMNNPTGTVNTQNASSGSCTANCVTWVTGPKFLVSISNITISGTNYAVASIISSTLLQLAANAVPETQNGATFSWSAAHTLVDGDQVIVYNPATQDRWGGNVNFVDSGGYIVSLSGAFTSADQNASGLIVTLLGGPENASGNAENCTVSTTSTSATVTFSTSCVNKNSTTAISIPGAGPSGGALNATVTACSTQFSCTLNATASASVGPVSFTWLDGEDFQYQILPACAHGHMTVENSWFQLESGSQQFVAKSNGTISWLHNVWTSVLSDGDPTNHLTYQCNGQIVDNLYNNGSSQVSMTDCVGINIGTFSSGAITASSVTNSALTTAGVVTNNASGLLATKTSPGAGAAVITGPTSSTTNDGACYADTVGTLKDCGGAPSIQESTLVAQFMTTTANWNPSTSTTLYLGLLQAPATTAISMPVPFGCSKITGATYRVWVSGTKDTAADNFTLKVYNVSTSTAFSDSATTFNAESTLPAITQPGALSDTVSAGNFIAVQVATPSSFGTAPTNIGLIANVYCQ